MNLFILRYLHYIGPFWFLSRIQSFHNVAIDHYFVFFPLQIEFVQRTALNGSMILCVGQTGGGIETTVHGGNTTTVISLTIKRSKLHPSGYVITVSKYLYYYYYYYYYYYIYNTPILGVVKNTRILYSYTRICDRGKHYYYIFLYCWR